MVVAMSSTFSDDPPVFSRTAPPQPQPPPPDYRTAFSINNNTNEAATAAALAFEEAKLLRDAEEASRLEAEALAATKKEDEERQRQLAIQEEWDAKNFASVKERVRRKIVLHLTDLTKTQRSSLQSDWQDKQRLEQSKGRLERQINDLANSKRSLEMAVKQVDQATLEVTAWLQDMADNNDDASTKERSIDDLVVPETTLDKQLLDLSAENHSLTDTMYFLDQALHRTTIDLQSYLKEIRALAKKQFLVKAHFIKITQTVRINQNSCY
jgi:ESCRT-I complex subunit TSG101